MKIDIELLMDRAALYELGEHIAAGASITPPTAEVSERLGHLLQNLAHSLDRRCSPYCDHLA